MNMNDNRISKDMPGHCQIVSGILIFLERWPRIPFSDRISARIKCFFEYYFWNATDTRIKYYLEMEKGPRMRE